MSAAQPPILVVDIETTSADRDRAGIVEIGAIWLHPAFNRYGKWFEVKCRPYSIAPIDPEAIAVNGCDWLDDPTVASEAEAIEIFNGWIAASLHVEDAKPSSLIMAGQNIGVFDWPILRRAFARADQVFPFSFRTYDLHALALQEALQGGIDDVACDGLKSRLIADMLGLPEEPKPHRALCGALLEHRALWELLEATPPPCDLGELEARFFPQVELPCPQ